MNDFQIGFFVFLACFILATIIIGLIEKHKAKKKAFAALVKENKQLKDEVYRLKFNAKLRGWNIDD